MRVFAPPIETHLIASDRASQTFQIQVMQPVMTRGADTRFPVLYLTDANLSFAFASGIARLLQHAQQAALFILVGIGYPSDNPFAATILRCRDLTPPHRPAIPGLPRQSPMEGVFALEPGSADWGEGDRFLAFFRHELLPFIDANYPTLPNQRGYFGHSLGGGLGLHALFSQSDLFDRYILSSPGICYGDSDYGLEQARAFIASGQTLDARVILSAAADEEFEAGFTNSHFASSVLRLASLLKQAAIPGLSLDCELFIGETHVSGWPLAFSRGVRRVYPPTASAAEPPA